MNIFKDDNLIDVKHGVWGYRRSNGTTHKGGDISTEGDKTEYPTVGGYVEFAGKVAKTSADPYTWQWGYHVRIFEGQSNATRKKGTRRHVYAHNEKNTVKTGQAVTTDTPIGIMGHSGNADPIYSPGQGDHVHYQVDEWNGSAWVNIDPTPYCGGTNTAGVVWYGKKKSEDEGMIDVVDVNTAGKLQRLYAADANAVAVDASGKDIRYGTGIRIFLEEVQLANMPAGYSARAAKIRNEDGSESFIALDLGNCTVERVDTGPVLERFYKNTGSADMQTQRDDALRAQRAAEEREASVKQKNAAAFAYVQEAQKASNLAAKALEG